MGINVHRQNGAVSTGRPTGGYDDDVIERTHTEMSEVLRGQHEIVEEVVDEEYEVDEDEVIVVVDEVDEDDDE